MIKKLLISILFIPLIGNSQSLLKGRIIDSVSDAGIAGVTIHNISQHFYKKTETGGYFSILANKDDTLSFSNIGYLRDTLQVTEDMFQNGLFLSLTISPDILDPVEVSMNNYRDSLQRLHQSLLLETKNQKSIVEKSGNREGFGLLLYPFSHYSKEQKLERKNRKKRIHDTEQEYISSRFYPAYVHRVTGLTGDKLQQFMLKYRPSYNFIVNATSEDLLVYINQSFIKFKKDAKG